MSEDENGFKIVDKRKGESSDVQESPDIPENSREAAGKDAEEQKTGKDSPGSEFYEVSFDRYLLQLATQALFALGLVPNPITKKTEKDIPAAKYTIDLLELIQQKTKGNLDENEEKILEDILYDLRMKYVQSIKK